MVDIITLTGPVAINIYVIEIVNLKSLVKLVDIKTFIFQNILKMIRDGTQLKVSYF